MKKIHSKLTNIFMEYFDVGPKIAFIVLMATLVILITTFCLFITSAPPRTLTMAAGPEGTTFHNHALKYQKELKESGIQLNILSTQGSIQNLNMINDPKSHVDIALVQSGSESTEIDIEKLNTLGAISEQPLFFFYRGDKQHHLKNFKDKRLAIGLEGSGARKLALQFLKLNGITEQDNLRSMSGSDASLSLINNEIDGAFLMGEDAPLSVLRTLLINPEIKLFNFVNADAYVRKIPILHLIELPQGVLNFEKLIPAKKVQLVGPTIELITRNNLHPAISDVLLDAATDIHGNAGIFKSKGEFPKAIENKIELSDDAIRFYKSGKSFLYRYLPFWPASLVNRLLIVLLPMLIILIPVLKSIPALFRWIGHLRIRRRYRALLRVEEKFRKEKDPEQLSLLSAQFEIIEKDIEQMRVRSALAMQFYTLRHHMEYVRRLLKARGY